MRIFGAIGALVICTVVCVSAGAGIGIIVESFSDRGNMKRGERRKAARGTPHQSPSATAAGACRPDIAENRPQDDLPGARSSSREAFWEADGMPENVRRRRSKI
jgi:hypothetical protein